MAWLHAASTLIDAGKNVILIEKDLCGWGMSWRSWWFLTPDSELGLRQIEQRYGKEIAKKLWDYGQHGQEMIVNLARDEKFNCDLQTEDSLLLGWKAGWVNEVHEEFAARQEYGYDGVYIPQAEIAQHTPGRHYSAGVRYTNCYAINPMLFCQEMKQYLIQRGVRIYEHTAIHSYTADSLTTSRWMIHCAHIIFTMGKVTKDVHADYAKDTYGIQNFITMSEPLSDALVKQLFPSGKLMCRDTKLAFTYFRMTWDNRLVLWGGNPITAGLPRDILYPYAIQSVIREIKDVYPALTSMACDFYRNGRIETTKDMMPIIDQDAEYPNHRRVQWCVGLPRAAASGRFAVQKLLGENLELAPLFLRNRRFRISRRSNSPLVKSILYGANNLYTMKRQKGY
jgi:gamma-glutamylputrescine oxidase